MVEPEIHDHSRDRKGVRQTKTLSSPRSRQLRDFPGVPVAKKLPMQGAQVPSLIRELDPTCHN